jgi:hypothetical protein
LGLRDRGLGLRTLGLCLLHFGLKVGLGLCQFSLCLGNCCFGASTPSLGFVDLGLQVGLSLFDEHFEELLATRRWDLPVQVGLTLREEHFRHCSPSQFAGIGHAGRSGQYWQARFEFAHGRQ